MIGVDGDVLMRRLFWCRLYVGFLGVCVFSWVIVLGIDFRYYEKFLLLRFCLVFMMLVGFIIELVVSDSWCVVFGVLVIGGMLCMCLILVLML